jgi:hypothetical protein
LLMLKFFLPLLTITAIASIATFYAGFQSGQSDALNPSASAASAEPEVTMATDSIRQPPVRQTIEAAPYQFNVVASDRWQTPMAKGEFYEGDHLLWQQDLPHQYGPRYSLIGQQGQVLLIDEYINVASPYALTVIAPDGQVTAQYSFDDIQSTLAVPRADIVRQAASGWWVSAPPTLSADGQTALIATGGTRLQVDLATGRISASPQAL